MTGQRTVSNGVQCIRIIFKESVLLGREDIVVKYMMHSFNVLVKRIERNCTEGLTRMDCFVLVKKRLDLKWFLWRILFNRTAKNRQLPKEYTTTMKDNHADVLHITGKDSLLSDKQNYHFDCHYTPVSFATILVEVQMWLLE